MSAWMILIQCSLGSKLQRKFKTLRVSKKCLTEWLFICLGTPNITVLLWIYFCHNEKASNFGRQCFRFLRIRNSVSELFLVDKSLLQTSNHRIFYLYEDSISLRPFHLCITIVHLLTTHSTWNKTHANFAQKFHSKKQDHNETWESTKTPV